VNKNAVMQKYHILASGIDSVNLAVTVSWERTEMFTYFDALKNKAREINNSFSGIVTDTVDSNIWPFDMKPHGTDGYAWLLIGNDYSMKIGNWTEPRTRPSIMVEIRSETLWRLGTVPAILRAVGVIESMGTIIKEIKLSRVDLCCDVMMPRELWSLELIHHAATRATDIAPYFKHRKLTGIRIGKGNISARLYDKPLEISQQSKKYWMYDIWEINKTPEGMIIIRIEFQLRRQFLKEVGMNALEDLFTKDADAWRYCTEKWLKFQTNPGCHHTQRKDFPWWKIIQNGYRGLQDGKPLVREKAFRKDKRHLTQQMLGLMTSLKAAEMEELGEEMESSVSLDECLATYLGELEFNNPKLHRELSQKIMKKRARYHRTK